MRTGDERAFEQLFLRYVSPLCGFAYSYVADRDVAEEIIQELFVSLWQQRFTLETRGGVRGYLFVAARNRALNALRTMRADHSLLERLSQRADATPFSVLPDELASAANLGEAVARVVAAMPTRCREVFTLLRQHHMTHAEAARVLSISPKTVEIHMGRALAILRASLAGWTEP